MCKPNQKTVYIHESSSLYLPTFCHFLNEKSISCKSENIYTSKSEAYVQDPPKIKLFQSENITAQNMKFSIKDFFSKCDQIRSFLWIWSHLLKKSLMKNFIFYAV